MHHAASAGHMNCVTFLVSFGSNLWGLDNQLHTPVDLAAINGHDDVSRYLDAVVTKQSLRNAKVVKRLKEKAVAEAQKRIRKYTKLQLKAQKHADKVDKRLLREGQRMFIGNQSQNSSVYSTLRNGKPATTSKSSSETKPYSAHFSITSTARRKLLLGSVAKKVNKQKRSQMSVNGSDFHVRDLGHDTRTLRSLSGLKRDNQILYVRGVTEEGDVINGGDNLSRAISEPDFRTMGEDSGIESTESPRDMQGSIFERPGFGSVAFLHHKLTPDTLLSLSSAEDDNKPLPTDHPTKLAIATPATTSKHNPRHKQESVKQRLRGSVTDSIGTIGSLAHRLRDLPWDSHDVESLDDDDTQTRGQSSLELFLSACGLARFLPVFTREDIDLDALMLLTEADLRGLELSMGPRRKLLDAIARRKYALASPGCVFDTRL